MATAGPSTGSAAAPAVDKQNEPARPLPLPSPTVHPAPRYDAEDVEAPTAAATRWRSAQYLRKRRRCALCCGGCCVTAVVVVGVVILVLALTVFKVKEPRLTVNHVWLTSISAGPGTGGLTDPAVAVNATLVADVSVKNPNAAAFRFSRSETDVSYRGQTVSVAYAPAGSVGADRTVRMNVSIDLLGDRLARAASNGTGLLFGREYDFDTFTAINGTVKVLGIVKKDVEIRLNCSIIVEVGGAAAVLVSGLASTVESKGVNCVTDVSM